MKLCDLPNDVLLGVFQETVTKATPFFSFNRGDLQLLAVCQRWRVLALGIVYNRIFLAYGRGKNGVPTNIGLVAAAGVTHRVRHVHITFVGPPACLQDVTQVMTTMRNAARQWPGVQELTIDAPLPHRRGWRGSTDVAPREDEMNNLCAVLVGLMPGIRRLVFSRSHEALLLSTLYGRLASIYAGQLTDLYCSADAQVPQTCRFSRLQIGYVDFKYEGRHLFRIDPATLVKLTLAKVDLSTSWALFSDGSGSSDIVFPVLQYLHLRFRGTYPGHPAIPDHDEGCPWQLHFPRLCSLRLGNAYNTVPPLGWLLLPRRLDHLHLSMLSNQFSGIEDMAIPACRDLLLVIHYYNSGQQCPFASVNRIMATAHQSDSSRLFVHDITMAVRPLDLTCTGLTDLFFSADTTLDDVVALIEKLPRLVYLGVSRLCLRYKMDGVAMPKRGAHLEPLKTKLWKLSIRFNWAYSNREQAVLATKFLLLKVPTLRELRTVESSLERVTAFTREYSQCYPHLATIRFSRLGY